MKKNDIMSDLRSLAHFLQNWGKNVKNVSVLSNLSIGETSKTSIDYNIDLANPLIFLNIDIERHVIPQGLDKLAAEKKDVEVKLTIQCQESKADYDDETDPIEKLGVAIMIDIIYFDDANNPVDVTCCWHLDKDDPKGALYCHPIYHMNFGGKHMIKQGNAYGKLLLLPSPRLVHPPLDIILACDFIIRNFYTKENHQNLTQDPGYRKLVDGAAKRYWKNYSYAFASMWRDDLKIKNLAPATLVGY